MIKGVGIDFVEVDRFADWHKFATAQLQRIFSIAEIAYCLEYTHLSAERFAVRFAAREAFFKAFQAANPTAYLSFLKTCRAVCVDRTTRGLPLLKINWDQLGYRPLKSHLSLTHSNNNAIAFVILENL